MKNCITLIGILALSSSVGLAEGEGRPQQGEGQRKKPNPAEIFKRLDQDSSGSISKSEFLSGKRAQKNPEMAAKMFDKLDADSSGDISRDEFAKRPARGNRQGGGEGRQPGQRPNSRPQQP